MDDLTRLRRALEEFRETLLRYCPKHGKPHQSQRMVRAYESALANPLDIEPLNEYIAARDAFFAWEKIRDDYCRQAIARMGKN